MGAGVGNYGRLAAEPADEFLERANIRPTAPVTERPAAHIAHQLPRLRTELVAAARDENLLLATFYDRKLIEPPPNAAPGYSFRTMPLNRAAPLRGRRAGGRTSNMYAFALRMRDDALRVAPRFYTIVTVWSPSGPQSRSSIDIGSQTGGTPYQKFTNWDGSPPHSIPFEFRIP